MLFLILFLNFTNFISFAKYKNESATGIHVFPIHNLEVHDSCTVEAWLGELWALLYYRVRWVQLCGSLSILWHCLSFGFEWKLTFSSPVATDEFSRFAGILSAALSQHHLSGLDSSTGIPSPPLALFIVMLSKAHLTSHSRMSGSRSVITPSWLSWSWRNFCTVLPYIPATSS